MTVDPLSNAGHSTRRDFLATAATVAAAGGAGLIGRAAHAQAPPQAPNEAGAPAGPVARVVFMPCIHLRDDLRANEGFAAALQAANRLEPRPDVIVTGGDLCHNLRDLGLDQATATAERFARILRENNDLPVRHCIGNHDLAGYRKGRDDFPADHPLFGKNMLKEVLGVETWNYGFDAGGWRIVVLDDVKLTEPGEYVGSFDDDALAVLRREVADHPGRPMLVFSHLPAVTATEFLGGRAEVKGGDWTLGTARMADNGAALIEAAGGGNVRAFASGHIHDVDRVEVAGHTFICSGSVSGQQWTGPRLPRPGCEEGFGVFDCRPDGTFDFDYHDYGWKADAADEGKT